MRIRAGVPPLLPGTSVAERPEIAADADSGPAAQPGQVGDGGMSALAALKLWVKRRDSPLARVVRVLGQ